MRYLIIAAVALLVACSPPQPAPLSAEDVAFSLEASGFAVAEIQTFDEQTDPNSLLGRPGQYVGKISWSIPMPARVETNVIAGQTIKYEIPIDARGTIELFADRDALDSRFAYTQAISNVGGLFAEYIYVNEERLALLRLSHQISPADAAAYEEWLSRL